MSDYKDGFSSNSKSELIYEKHYTDEHELVYIKLRCPKDNSEMKVTHTAKFKRKKQKNGIVIPIYTCPKCSKRYTSINEHSDGQKIKIDDASYTNLLAKSHSVNYYRADSAHTRKLSKASFYLYTGSKTVCCNPNCNWHKLSGVYVALNHKKGKSVDYIKWCSKCNLYYIRADMRYFIDKSFNIINIKAIEQKRQESIALQKKYDKANKERVERLKELESKKKVTKTLKISNSKKENTVTQTNNISQIQTGIVLNGQMKNLGEHIIGTKDFVIKSNIFRCRGENHKLEDITAIFSVVDKNGNVQEKKVTAGFCASCGVYFIVDSVYEELRRSGVPLCRISDSKTFFSGNGYNNMHLANESILRQFGYNVSNNNGLTENARHKILAVIIDKNVLTKNEIIAYLDFFINQRKNNDKFYMAIAKWETDRNFVSQYKLGSYESYGVSGLYR